MHCRHIDGDPFKMKVIVDLTTSKRIPVANLNHIFVNAIDDTQRIGDYPVTRDAFYLLAELPGELRKHKCLFDRQD